MDIATTIDARGMLCPLPVLRLRRVLAALPAGAVVELLATDGASWIDVPHFCAGAGHVLISAEDTAGLRYLVRKG
ncbi:sulfurtransferase TusA family protein [Paenirhodobacter ferrireducens]|uniref:sulfurtransferase TusA family protein n=1 Tax=Paenirhodobacter ferrireducens TaxID=1215032 RepID=UPI0013E2EA95|nr:sulfurtransferase TusA family protein [Sinirhodobacter ferrireducens]